ncbi:MAG TPA: hypothetical protein VGB84_00145 [Arachidicoccus sp.]
MNITRIKQQPVTLLLALLLTTGATKAQLKNKNPIVIERIATTSDSTVLLNKISRLSGKIFSGYTISDSLDYLNDSLLYALQTCVSVFPDFMYDNFPDWEKNGLKIATSTDHKFRIICWNDKESGTNREWKAIMYWQTIKDLYAVEPGDTDYINLSPEYTGITDIRLDNENTVYLVQARGHEDNRYKFDFIKGYKINSNDLIDDDVTLFKNATKSLNKIELKIDLASIDKSTSTSYPLIHFSQDHKMLFIPLTDNNGKIKEGYYLIYRFNGKAFVFDKTIFNH